MTDDELKRLFEATRQESAAMHVETRRHFDEKAAETQRHFDVVAERLEKRFDLLVETVGRLDEKIDRETRGIRDRCSAGSRTRRP